MINYKKPVEQQDYGYVLDLNQLADQLGDEYIIMYRDHHFMSRIPKTKGAPLLDVSAYESQELLLIADHLITDYSSILFDALAANIPTSLYTTDYIAYSKSRGVYTDIWTDIQSLCVTTINKLAESIKSPRKISRQHLRKYMYNEKTPLTGRFFIKN